MLAAAPVFLEAELDSPRHSLASSMLLAADLGDAEGEEVAAPDLVALAQALTAANVKLYGAAWAADSTQQRELFEDGGDFLPFIEVTNPDRMLNQIGSLENITVFPTWKFPDGSRVEGVLGINEIADRSGVTIPLGVDPFLAPVENQIVLGGSPSHIALNGYDPNGGPLTFTVESSDPTLVTATVLQGNRSAKVRLFDWGEMVFELFESRVPRAAGRFIELVEAGFYDAASNDPDMTLHRVIDNFMLQFGDPTGTGSGGSTLDDFDDQFHPELQHNRAGVLSWAKGGDDTNNSQVFVTDVPTRHLDFNHSVFGQLTEGDSVRNAVTATKPGEDNHPVVPVNIESVQIFRDTENAILMLKAASGTVGETDITITVTDQDGHNYVHMFHVEVFPDPYDGGPYLHDYSALYTWVDTELSFQMHTTDVESDPIMHGGLKGGSVDYDLVVDSQTGEVVVTPPAGFVGALGLLLWVRAENPSDTQDDYDLQWVAILVAPKWHNVTDPVDVNTDGVASPLDALLIVNYLNANAGGPLPEAASPPPYYDVNGDDSCSPIDVLLVINHLNQAAQGEGEGGSTADPGEDRDAASEINQTSSVAVHASMDCTYRQPATAQSQHSCNNQPSLVRVVGRFRRASRQELSFASDRQTTRSVGMRNRPGTNVETVWNKDHEDVYCGLWIDDLSELLNAPSS